MIWCFWNTVSFLFLIKQDTTPNTNAQECNLNPSIDLFIYIRTLEQKNLSTNQGRYTSISYPKISIISHMQNGKRIIVFRSKIMLQSKWTERRIQLQEFNFWLWKVQEQSPSKTWYYQFARSGAKNCGINSGPWKLSKLDQNYIKMQLGEQEKLPRVKKFNKNRAKIFQRWKCDEETWITYKYKILNHI